MSRKFQYSLRTIFTLVLLAAAFFGGMAVQRQETERVRRIAEQERDRAAASKALARQAVDQLYSELARRAEAEVGRAEAGSDDGQP
jgi:Flp pilus assembly protein TadB